MLFRRLYHDSLAQASYLIACERSKEAIVVDPLRDPAPYLEAARMEGVRITQVTETHVHADFLSGAAELARASGAQLLLSGEGASPASYQREHFTAAKWLRDGEQLRLGRLRLDVLHVPGHTPEHVALLLTDEGTSEVPAGLLSGDFLFVGDVGRPDLLERAAGVRGTMESSARDLFASLQRVRVLPDFIQLWPGHGAGSACGKALGAVPQSTLGYELRANWAFAEHDVNEFVRQVLAGQPEPPAYFARMKRLNARGGLPLPRTRQMLAGGEAAAALRQGAQLIDLRPPAEFAAGHVPRALNLPWGKSFLGWAGSVLPTDQDIVLLAPAGGRAAAERAARDLGLIGVDRVLGVVAADEMAGELVATLHTIDASELGPRAPLDAVVLDVRDRGEWQQGHVPGARHIPLAQLAARLEELRDTGPLLVHCQGGSRSAVAASVLLASGFRDVSNVAGGYAAWERAGHSAERDG
jgi:hydroxyacylglutathione hydrolase